MKEPWLLLLASIPALFAIEPTPAIIGLGELNIIILLGTYVVSTYFQVIRTKPLRQLSYVLKSNAIIFILIAVSAGISLYKGVGLLDWGRGIAPFLLLYLALPISITLEQEFDSRIKWYFISFSVLALMLIFYINTVFFIEHFYSYYWVSPENGSRIYSLTNTTDPGHWLGPYHDRITLRIQESTSELLPISFTLFGLIAILTNTKALRLFAFAVSTASLFTILVNINPQYVNVLTYSTFLHRIAAFNSQ